MYVDKDVWNTTYPLLVHQVMCMYTVMIAMLIHLIMYVKLHHEDSDSYLCNCTNYV